MTIGITGASGTLGRLVTARLLDLVHPTELVLTSRQPDSLADVAALGATVRPADFSDPSSLASAFAGIDKLLLVSTDRVGDRVAGHLAAIDAAAAAGVRHIVYTSVPEPVDANPALVVPDHRATEDALHAGGPAWTFLRNNLYADMQVPALSQAAATGQLITNVDAGRAAYVTRADCAAAAAAVLTSDGHESAAYDITGPAALSADDLAALAGASVTVVNVDDAGYTAGLIGAGLPEPITALLTSFGVAIRQGYLETVTSAVYHLTGQQPTPLQALLS